MTVQPGDLESYRDSSRAWLAANLDRRSGSGRVGRAGGVDPTPGFIAEQRALQRRIAEGGYAGITWPKERGAGRDTTAAAAGAVPTGRALAPDLVALARAGGLLGDVHVRQQIARAHINDQMHDLLGRRVATGMRLKVMDAGHASFIKLGSGINLPLRARIAMEIAGVSAVAWAPGDPDGNATSTAYLNGRIMSIAGGSNQIQRNIISERVLGLPREPSYDTDKPFREVQRDSRSWSS